MTDKDTLPVKLELPATVVDWLDFTTSASKFDTVNDAIEYIVLEYLATEICDSPNPVSLKCVIDTGLLEVFEKHGVEVEPAVQTEIDKLKQNQPSPRFMSVRDLERSEK